VAKQPVTLHLQKRSNRLLANLVADSFREKANPDRHSHTGGIAARITKGPVSWGAVSSSAFLDTRVTLKLTGTHEKELIHTLEARGGIAAVSGVGSIRSPKKGQSNWFH